MIHGQSPGFPSACLAAALLYGCAGDAPGAGDALFCAEAEARVDVFLSGFDAEESVAGDRYSMVIE